MAKKRKFNLLVLGGGTKEFTEIETNDYDLEAGLVRYKTTVYDLRTGLWIVKLESIQNDTGTWKGCGSYKGLTISKMISTIMDNKIFMERLKRQREKAKEAETKNETVLDLFTMEMF